LAHNTNALRLTPWTGSARGQPQRPPRPSLNWYGHIRLGAVKQLVATAYRTVGTVDYSPAPLALNKIGQLPPGILAEYAAEVVA